MVLPHQTIALSMVQEWQYQVRLNPFLELRHRQKSLTHAIPYTLLISQCLQKTPLTLTPEVPHKQNKHPKQKEKKKPTQARSNISSANTSTLAICLQEMSEAAWQPNSEKNLKEWRAFSYFSTKWKSFLQYLNWVYFGIDANKHCYCLREIKEQYSKCKIQTLHEFQHPSGS